MNKKIFSIAAIFLLCSAFGVSAQQTGTPALTAEDYARADKMLGFTAAQYVDRSGVRPTWLPDGRFYYRVMTPTGSEYVLVNPSDGKRQTAADLAKLNLPLLLLRRCSASEILA